MSTRVENIWISNLICLVASFAVGLNLNAQNLVPNSSFEGTNLIQQRWCPSAEDFEKRIKVWSSPSLGSPDILFDRFMGSMLPVRPFVNLAGYKPRTGRLMSSVRVYGCINPGVHCKEYLQVPFKEPLRKGRKYRIEYYVTPLQNGLRVNQFGVALSRHEYREQESRGVLYLKPVFESEEIIDAQKNEWVRIGFDYVAEESSTHLIIGVFKADHEMRTEAPDSVNSLGYAFYFIDDVSVVDITDGVRENTIMSDSLSRYRIVFDSGYFEFDEDELTQNGKKQLQRFLSEIPKGTIRHVRIAGHSDSVGTEDYNMDLSERRAQSVLRFLMLEGYDRDIMHASGYGYNHPISKIAAENRRVEITIEYEN